MMLCARGPDFRSPRRGRPVHLSSAAHLGRPAVLDQVAPFARIAVQADSRAARTVHSAGRFVRPVGGSSPCRLPSIVLPRTRDWRILRFKNCCNLVAIESREVGTRNDATVEGCQSPESQAWSEAIHLAAAATPLAFLPMPMHSAWLPLERPYPNKTREYCCAVPARFAESCR